MSRTKTDNAVAAKPWHGPVRRYDLIKEFTIALGVIAVLVLGLSAVFSSPDSPAVTFREWAANAPDDFAATASSELDGSSGSASYGPPYQDIPDAGQAIGSVNPAQIVGVHIPIDSAADFVVRPLETIPDPTPQLRIALKAWKAADPDTQVTWAENFTAALEEAPDGDPTRVAKGDYGPVPVMVVNLLAYAQSGGLDGVMASDNGHFYNTNYTKSVLFLADGSYLEDKAVAEHLGGDQNGMMNETGAYPGQQWLWYNAIWYQFPPFNNEETTMGASADLYIMSIIGVIGLIMLFLPKIPVLNRIPRWIPIHRLVWRDWYRYQSRHRE